jgi:hypothetical protein
MDNEVRPTWGLAWGLWWRMLLISLGIGVVIGAIMLVLFLLGVICIPSCGSFFGWLPWGL